MEIGPIAGIRAIPVRTAPPAEAELTVLPDIENSARVEDDTWSPTADGSDDDGEKHCPAGETAPESEAESDSEAEPEAEAGPKIFSPEDIPNRQVNIFA